MKINAEEEEKLLNNEGGNNNSNQNSKIFFLASLNCLPSFLIGFTTAVISGAIDPMTTYFDITNVFLKGFLVW